MASGDRDLSTRKSTEDQNRDHKQIYEAALKHFRKCKVDISYAIQHPFPFLELLRDHEFITNKAYEEFRASLRKRISLQEMVYDILSKLEETFDLSLLQVLFSQVPLMNYPNLKRICESFRNVIPDKNFFPETAGEERGEWPAIQPNIEQETGENSLSWIYTNAWHDNGTTSPESEHSEHRGETEQINAMRNDAASDNNDALESQQASEQRAQEPEPAVASSDSLESSDREDTYEVTPSETQSAPGVPRGNEARTEIGQASDMMDTVNLGNNSTLQKARRKRRFKEHTDGSVNFDSAILPVTCGKIKADLIKRKFERGGTVKSVRTEDGNWLTPRELEVAGGYEKSSNWKLSVRCGGKTLKWLMETGKVTQPPRKRGRKKRENSDVCTICQDRGKLFSCSTCSKYFHEECHIPPVETERSPWSCTFCRMEAFSGSQECHRLSEVLERQMGPEEKLKCEFLLLKVYCRLERSLLKEIPHDNYIEMASQCLNELKMLANIKKKLNEGGYPQVKGFVCEVDRIFQSDAQSTNHNDSDLTHEEFKKNFKKTFGIQETMKNSTQT